MPYYKAKAVILKSYKLGESDKIVKMYSYDGDVISAVAKGARKIRSKFRGRLELFNIVDMELSRGRNLDVINQAEIIKSFKNIALDFYKFVFCEIISKIILKTQASGGDPSPLLFKLIYVCFDEIDRMDPEDVVSLKKTMCFFGIKFLKVTGYIPLLKSCSRCNQDLSDLYSFSKHKIYFSVKDGGVLCRKCAGFTENKEVLSASDYRFLCDLFKLKSEDFRDIEINPHTLKKMYRLIENYIVYHTECNVDSFKYFKKIGL